MKIQIAICEDERRQAEYIRTLAEHWADENNIDAKINIFENAEVFKSAALKMPYHILLLDIQMNGQNGIALAKEIRQTDTGLIIIFITGYTDFMPEGYDVNAFHYLLKPVNEEKFFEVIAKAVKHWQQANKSWLIKNESGIFPVLFSDIKYIEACDHYIVIRTVSGEHKMKMNLSKAEASLDNRFFRCQRSFIVNLSFIYKITRTNIVLNDKTEVPLSRKLYNAANQAVIRFFPNN